MPKNTALSELRRKHAAQFGLSESRVELVALDLEILNRTGTFVRIFAGGLTMFVRRANWRELGVPDESARKLRYKAPPKYLIDPEEVDWFRNTAQRARDSLGSVSADVEFMHPYRWVGYKDWARWLAEFRSTQAEWVQRRGQLIDNYDDHFQQMVDDFTCTADEAYEALQAAGVKDLPPQDEFVRIVVSGAVARMPSPQYIEERLILEYIVPAVVTPTTLEEELLQRDRLRQERELEAERARQRLQMEREVAAIERQIELDARQEEMFRQRLEQYRRQAESLQAPLEQVLDQLYEEIEETTSGTLDVLRAHGGLRGRSGERLRALAGRVQMLEDLGQSNLLRVIREAGALTEAAGDDETDEQAAARTGALQAVLGQIGNLVNTGERAGQSLGLVAREMDRHTWRSVCLVCRHVWQSNGSLEPVFCPQCKADRVASRET